MVHLRGDLMIEEMASLSAREFMQTILADSLLTKVLFTGYDHRFGHNRKALPILIIQLIQKRMLT